MCLIQLCLLLHVVEAHTQFHLPAARRDQFRVPALILGLLCLLLVAGLTVFYKFCEDSHLFK